MTPLPPLTLELPPAVLEQLAHRVAELLGGQASVPEPWVTVDQAARHLGYDVTDPADAKRGRKRIYDLTSEKRIHPRRDGRRLLFRLSDLDRDLERGDL